MFHGAVVVILVTSSEAPCIRPVGLLTTSHNLLRPSAVTVGLEAGAEDSDLGAGAEVGSTTTEVSQGTVEDSGATTVVEDSTTSEDSAVVNLL